MTFGERLRDARVRASISQTQLTRLSGVPKTMLSRYENDHILPSIGTLHKLAVALGTGESTLLGDEASPRTFEEELNRRGIDLIDGEAVSLAKLIADMVEEQDTRVQFLRAARADHA